MFDVTQIHKVTKLLRGRSTSIVCPSLSNSFNCRIYDEILKFVLKTEDGSVDEDSVAGDHFARIAVCVPFANVGGWESFLLQWNPISNVVESWVS